MLQCFGNKAAEQYIAKEYLAYKVYEEITPYSFKIKPIRVNINLYDDEDDAPKHELVGLIIESDDELATRLNGKMIKRDRAGFNIMEREPRLTMSLFQYLIANTDWYAGNLHNLEIIKIPEYNRVVPIPYDFDYSGMVGAHYAAPHENIPIKSVTTRYYLGPPCKKEEYEATIEVINQKKEAIKQIILNCQLLEEKNKNFLWKYIANGFETMNASKKAFRIFKVET